ncbi:(2Fe-2S)-binding protein [Litorimonas sp. RW-G-Af-16]|uniref:(2Fe-2S)-binding protein n=1 Tax=Litorimonas sp. RW-G-Af-16 TaxID=3241168 RepID=UPI00390CC826
MIYCVCNNINTAAVDRAAKAGAETAACVQKSCGTRFNCGQCKVDIQARLMELRALDPAITPCLQAAE